MAQFIRLLIASLLLVLATSMAAQARKAVVPVDHYPPWKITTNREAIAGIDVELVLALTQRAHITPEFQAYPWKRCLFMMENGTADLISGVTKRTEREKYLIYLEPPYKTKSTKAFYMRKDDMRPLAVYGDLRSLRIGVAAGNKLNPRFDEDESLVKDEAPDDLSNIRKLIAGRIDAFVSTEITADDLIRTHGFGSSVRKADLSFSKPVAVYFAVSKQSPLAARVPELNSHVLKMVESGEVERILRAYRTQH